MEEGIVQEDIVYRCLEGPLRALFTVNTIVNLTDAALRRIFRDIGLQPTDLPLRDHPENPSDEDERKLVEYFLARARPIFDRMPANTADDKVKKERAQSGIRYCSVLPVTGTQFMVTREIEGALTFRLVNDKIEFLQEGCEELIERLGLQKRWWQQASPGEFVLAGRIEIYEHGLEASTIRGTPVRNKFSYALRHSSKDIVLAVGAFAFFVVALTLGASDAIVAASKLAGHLDRFSTAMATTVVVSSYSIVHTLLTATPPVAWTAHYEREE